jgi:hypothetical protein
MYAKTYRQEYFCDRTCWNFFFPWRWGGSSTQAWIPTYVSILRIPQMIRVWRVTVEWHIDRGKPKNWENPVPVPLCPPQIPHGLARAPAVRGRWLTTWAMARPNVLECCPGSLSQKDASQNLLSCHRYNHPQTSKQILGHSMCSGTGMKS